MRHILPLTLIALAAPALAQTSSPKADMTAITYPATDRGDTVDEQFGVKVADPYRWLENDVRQDARVRDWVTAENRVTDAYLATLPGRYVFRRRMIQLFDYERYGLPVPAEAQAYADRLLALPGAQAWIDDALKEHDFVPFDEPYRSARD